MIRQHFSITLLSLGLTFSSSAQGGGGGASPILFGDWQITAYRFGDNISVDDAQSRSYVGQRLSYSATRVLVPAPVDGASGLFKTETCLSPTYQLSHLTTQAFQSAYRTSLSSIGLRIDAVNIMTVHCPENPWIRFSTILLLSDRMALTVWDGVYYVMKREGNY